MTTNKKMKTSNEDDSFEELKRYILDCPTVPSDHPAVKAALAVDKEQQKNERDRKLQMKFSGAATTVQEKIPVDTRPDTSTAAFPTETENLSDSVVVVDGQTSPHPSSTDATNGDDSADEMMEWQDVTEKDKDVEDDNTSLLGKNLAKITIDAVSEHQVKVKSPLAAIAAALHASLRSTLLGFSCTGVPEQESSSKSGFAAPIRELPPSQFLPSSWEKSRKIALRYRKRETGAVVLSVEQGDDDTITVHFLPANSKEPPGHVLEFPLAHHVNLDSWTAAHKTSSSVSPSLHYKSLAALLTNFARTFDLGSVTEEGSDTAVPYVDNTIVGRTPSVASSPAHPALHKSDFVQPQHPGEPATGIANPSTGLADPHPNWRDVPSTLDDAFPGPRGMYTGGDFAGDLAPAGLRDPRFMPSGGRMGGNLMGPNHPLFQGGGGMGVGGPAGILPMGGPGTMQPRYDPVLPFGIDDPLHPGQRRPNAPRRNGEPNPDHLRPPDSLGDNMFS